MGTSPRAAPLKLAHLALYAVLEACSVNLDQFGLDHVEVAPLSCDVSPRCVLSSLLPERRFHVLRDRKLHEAAPIPPIFCQAPAAPPRYDIKEVAQRKLWGVQEGGPRRIPFLTSFLLPVRAPVRRILWSPWRLAELRL